MAVVRPRNVARKKKNVAVCARRSASRLARAGALAIVAVLGTDLGAVADERAVNRLDVSRTQSEALIVVHFNMPVAYQSHAPVEQGSTIQIELRPLRDSEVQSATLDGKERVPVAQRDGVPLTDASYEALTPTSARLTLSFARSVKFRVAQASGSRSLEITLGDLAAEVDASAAAAVDVVMEAPPPNAMLAEAVPQAALPPGEITTTMSDARDAMTNGDNNKAIRLLTKVIESDDAGPAKPEALEMLGLARERNKQIAHAKAEYEEYLRLYPSGEGADRVRQRLAGLLTAASKPRAKLREPSRAQEKANGQSDFFFRGSFSQTLRRDQNLLTEAEDDGLSRFGLESDLDATVTYADSDVVVSLRGNGGYVHDFTNEDDGSEGRISSLFLEISDPDREMTGRIGRQSRSSDGVLGRFDGALWTAQVFDELRLNLVAGMPVESSTDLFVARDRYFTGIGIDLGPIFENWYANVYAINQTAGGITDRRAVGAEVRYTQPDATMFGLFDYDLSYGKINVALLSGNYVFEDRSTFNFAVDYRTSPFLTTTTALQGQPVGTIKELLMMFNEDEIRQLALDRTATVKSVSIGASHPFNDNFQIGADAMITDISGTIASGGVDGSPRTGMEYEFGVQATGSNLFTDSDIVALGLRYADLDQSDRATIDLNARFPVTPRLRLNPRIRTDYRWNDDGDGTQLSVKPSLRATYRPTDDGELEVEVGADWRQTETGGTRDESLGYAAYVSYRIEF